MLKKFWRKLVWFNMVAFDNNINNRVHVYKLLNLHVSSNQVSNYKNSFYNLYSLYFNNYSHFKRTDMEKYYQQN
jgi:hypothetical protein